MGWRPWWPPAVGVCMPARVGAPRPRVATRAPAPLPPLRNPSAAKKPYICKGVGLGQTLAYPDTRPATPPVGRDQSGPYLPHSLFASLDRAFYGFTKNMSGAEILAPPWGGVGYASGSSSACSSPPQGGASSPTPLPHSSAPTGIHAIAKTFSSRADNGYTLRAIGCQYFVGD